MSEREEEILKADPFATYTTIKAIPMAVMMMPTMQLRFSKGDKLQQLWTDIFLSKSEWRDIPTEE